jgi:hypothetical protein
MSELHQLELFGKHDKYVQGIYVPPDTAVIKEFAYLVCTHLEEKNTHPTRQEIASGLAGFVNFVAQASAKYLNKGHKSYLLEGFTKSVPEKK